jgi:hypothetical protein
MAREWSSVGKASAVVGKLYHMDSRICISYAKSRRYRVGRVYPGPGRAALTGALGVQKTESNRQSQLIAY